MFNFVDTDNQKSCGTVAHTVIDRVGLLTAYVHGILGDYEAKPNQRATE